MRFKVNDPVNIIATNGRLEVLGVYPRPEKGHIKQIAAFGTHTPYLIDIGVRSWWFAKQDLELIENDDATVVFAGHEEGKAKMKFRVRETDDNKDTWVVTNGCGYETINNYIRSDGTICNWESYATEQKAQDALDLYLAKHEEEQEKTKKYPECPRPPNLDPIRTFSSGATRDTVNNKLDYDGFLSPLVLERYAYYLHKHRKTVAGLRNSDNWQKGIPISVYMKSKWRHFMDTWRVHRGWLRLKTFMEMPTDNIQESLCAELFNTMGMLHEIIKLERDTELGTDTDHTKPIPNEY